MGRMLYPSVASETALRNHDGRVGHKSQGHNLAMVFVNPLTVETHGGGIIGCVLKYCCT